MLVEIAYREQPSNPLITHHLEVEEITGSPVVVREWLQWKRGRYGAPFRFLDSCHGVGRAVTGELPDVQDALIDVRQSSSDTLMVSALGQLAENPRALPRAAGPA